MYNSTHEFLKGFVTFLCFAFSLIIVINWISEGIAYNNNMNTIRIVQCQQAGYSFGECYNTLVRDTDSKFVK